MADHTYPAGIERVIPAEVESPNMPADASDGPPRSNDPHHGDVVQVLAKPTWCGRVDKSARTSGTAPSTGTDDPRPATCSPCCRRTSRSGTEAIETQHLCPLLSVGAVLLHLRGAPHNLMPVSRPSGDRC
jgi:hypothetical protein